mgnify:CR=1 FL=1
MELFDNLATGFSVAFTLSNLAYAFIGCLLGTLIGVLPGIGPLATIAMLLPATYSLEPVSALIMLAGIYYGAQYGGSTTAILVNLPGESSSVVTVIDGYQMARQGKAGKALACSGKPGHPSFSLPHLRAACMILLQPRPDQGPTLWQALAGAAKGGVATSRRRALLPAAVAQSPKCRKNPWGAW